MQKMATHTNQYGLSRTIPAQVKREVRKRCGFGCVVCGIAIAQYEHFDPAFVDAKKHDSSGITLLCASCHDKKTRGIWSVDKIRECNAMPYCITNGRARDAFDISSAHPLVIIGSTFWFNSFNILNIMGESVLKIEAPIEDNCPYQLSGSFEDDETGGVLIIDKNEWMPLLGQWDCEVVGRVVTIRKGPRRKVLELEMLPRIGIRIKAVDITFRGAQFYGDNNSFTVKAPDGSAINIDDYPGFLGIECRSAIIVSEQTATMGQECLLTGSRLADTNTDLANLCQKVDRYRMLLREWRNSIMIDPEFQDLSQVNPELLDLNNDLGFPEFQY